MMSETAIDKIKKACELVPFRPFVVRLSDGRSLPVYYRDSVNSPPGGTTVVIRQPDEHLEISDASRVLGLEFAENIDHKTKRGKPVTIEQIRRLYEAQPFQPFVIHLASGRQVPVPHREFMWAAPSGRTIFVELPDQSVDIIDLLLVSDIVRMPPTNGTRKRKQR